MLVLIFQFLQFDMYITKARRHRFRGFLALAVQLGNGISNLLHNFRLLLSFLRMSLDNRSKAIGGFEILLFRGLDLLRLRIRYLLCRKPLRLLGIGPILHQFGPPFPQFRHAIGGNACDIREMIQNRLHLFSRRTSPRRFLFGQFALTFCLLFFFATSFRFHGDKLESLPLRFFFSFSLLFHGYSHSFSFDFHFPLAVGILHAPFFRRGRIVTGRARPGLQMSRHHVRRRILLFRRRQRMGIAILPLVRFRRCHHTPMRRIRRNGIAVPSGPIALPSPEERAEQRHLSLRGRNALGQFPRLLRRRLGGLIRLVLGRNTELRGDLGGISQFPPGTRSVGRQIVRRRHLQRRMRRRRGHRSRGRSAVPGAGGGTDVDAASLVHGPLGRHGDGRTLFFANEFVGGLHGLFGFDSQGGRGGRHGRRGGGVVLGGAGNLGGLVGLFRDRGGDVGVGVGVGGGVIIVVGGGRWRRNLGGPRGGSGRRCGRDADASFSQSLLDHFLGRRRSDGGSRPRYSRPGG
mmetsp:Transcript_21831/g.45694  ORF Transcript_21831/g.45694 Transcript_21831/m.45694 type:complete len:517 (-) Transcript_21831:1008-2558(-)